MGPYTRLGRRDLHVVEDGNSARWLHEPQPIINQPVELGFPNRAGRIDPGDLRSSSGCWRFADSRAFVIRGWELILPGCGGTSTFARGATLYPEMGRCPPRVRQDLDVGPRGNSRRALAP